MADRHDPSRWQASGQQPWSGNDRAFRPDNPSSGPLPAAPSPRTDRCFAVAELGGLGLELEGLVIAEVVYQLAGLIEERSTAGDPMPPLSEQSVSLQQSGAVTWGPAVVDEPSVDDVRATEELVAMARRLIDGQVVGAALARLLMSTSVDPQAIRECLAVDSDRKLVATVVAQAMTKTDGPQRVLGASADEAGHGPSSATGASTAERQGRTGAGPALRSPRAHRTSSQPPGEPGSSRDDSGITRVLQNVQALATRRRIVILAAGVLVAAVGFGALAQGAPNEIVAAAEPPEGEVTASPVADPSTTESATTGPGSSASATPTADATTRPSEEQPASAAASSIGTPQPGRSATDWQAVVSDLDSSRSRAFETGDATLLDRVNVADSPAWVADRRMLNKLSVSGLRARGLATVIERVEVKQQSAERIRLVVTDRRPAYQLVSASTGATVSKVAARSELVWRVRLTPSDESTSTGSGGWRIYSVEAA
ncbi:MAG: hypothetical protein WAV88_12710 [Candidatus Nanopelagicales bacterium]